MFQLFLSILWNFQNKGEEIMTELSFWMNYSFNIHAWNEIQMLIAHQNSLVNLMVTALHNSIDVDANLIGEIHLVSSSF